VHQALAKFYYSRAHILKTLKEDGEEGVFLSDEEMLKLQSSMDLLEVIFSHESLDAAVANKQGHWANLIACVSLLDRLDHMQDMELWSLLRSPLRLVGKVENMEEEIEKYRVIKQKMHPSRRSRRVKKTKKSKKEKPFFPVVCLKVDVCKVCDERVEDENPGGEIACDSCDHWFHLRCLGKTKAWAKNVETFTCIDCEMCDE